MKNIVSVMGLVVFGLIGGCGHSAQEDNAGAPSAMLYTGGTIITMEGEAGSATEAVVTEGKKVAYTGSLEEAQEKFPHAVLYDLQGSTMMPGFIEQHLHPFLAALTLSVPVIAPEPWELPGVTWPAAHTHAEYIARLQAIEMAMEDAQEPLFTWGYHPYFHGKVNRHLLDSISPTRPIAVWHRSCHEFYLNTAMINRYGITQEVIDKLGQEVKQQADLAEGHFYENAAIFVLLPRIMPDLGNPQRFKAGLEQMLTMLHNKGITAYNEPGAFIQPSAVELYKAVLGAEDVPMYSFFIPQTKTPYYQFGKEGFLEAVQKSTEIFPAQGKVRFFAGQAKILADGAMVSQLMQMQDGYLDGHQGEWIQRPEEIEAITEVLWQEGYQIHIHVNGDLGLAKVLDIIERRIKAHPRPDHRTTIVHFGNSTPQQIKKLAELGCIVSANPYYVTVFGNKFADIGLGPARAHAMARLGPLEAAGVPVSLHSDLPIAPADPLYLAWCAVSRQTIEGNALRPELGLSVHAAMKAITIEAAYSWRMEDSLGSIKAGKIANFTILDKNPYLTGADGLPTIKVRATVFEGKEFPVKQRFR